MSKLWLWGWEIPAMKAATDGTLDGIVARCKADRLALMVKTHDGLTTNGAWDPDAESAQLVQKCLDAGVDVRAWGYVYPNVDPVKQAAVAMRTQTDYVADAEVEWDGHATEAYAFVAALRAERDRIQTATGKTITLGYAPLPVVSYHDTGQYPAFNQLDVACPQAYAGTGGRDAIGALNWTADEWGRAYPGCNIEPAVYAPDQSADALRAAIALVRSNARAFGHDGDVSVWSYQHLTGDQWNLLAELQAPPAELPVMQPAIPALTTAPTLAGQSVDLVLKPGQVGAFVAHFDYAGTRVLRGAKAYAHTPGRYIVAIYPLAEDETTEHADATPARCVLDVTA